MSFTGLTGVAVTLGWGGRGKENVNCLMVEWKGKSLVLGRGERDVGLLQHLEKHLLCYFSGKDLLRGRASFEARVLNCCGIQK